MKAIEKLTQVENYCKCIDITERDELVEMVSDSKDLVMELYAALTRLTVCSKIITSKDKNVRKAYENAKKVLSED